MGILRWCICPLSQQSLSVSEPGWERSIGGSYNQHVFDSAVVAPWLTTSPDCCPPGTSMLPAPARSLAGWHARQGTFGPQKTPDTDTPAAGQPAPTGDGVALRNLADLMGEGELMPVYVHVIDHPDARVTV